MKHLLILLLFTNLSACNLLDGQTNTRPMNDGSDIALTPDTGGQDLLISCFDGQKNGEESDFDCGGNCRPCDDNRVCGQSSDCSSSVCTDNLCTPARCNDNVKNASESDIDCGGDCDACSPGAQCVLSKDCENNSCVDGKCAVQTCADGKKNGAESDIDCGGDCLPCSTKKQCSLDSDCASGDACRSGVCGEWWNPAWRRRATITFLSPYEIENFYAYLIVPEIPDAQVPNIRFVQRGKSLPSEPDTPQKSGFWVRMPKITIGQNTFSVYTDYEGVQAPANDLPMWNDFIAVYHVPNTQDVAQNFPPPQGPPPTTMGLFNAANHFSGSATSHLIVADPKNKLDQLFPTITISAWIKPNIIKPGWHSIVSRQLNEDNKEDFNLTTNNGFLRGCAGNISCSRNDGTALPTNVWSHVAFVYNLGVSKIFLNGTLEYERVAERIRPMLARNLVFGGNQNNATSIVDEHFSGDIDEIRITQNALDEEELSMQFLSAQKDFFVFGQEETK